MCLAVSKSIHPISAPTGTEEDIVGNNKADASIAIEVRVGSGGQGVSAIFFSNRTKSPAIAVIDDTSRPGMHLRRGRKNCLCDLPTIGPAAMPVRLLEGCICNP